MFDREAEIAGANQDREKLHGKIAAGTIDAFMRHEASELLEANDLPKPPESSEEFRTLCEGILRAKSEQRRILTAMLQGQYELTQPMDPLFNGNVIVDKP
jgi:hypothetical protein